jgi:hypothetical protein
MNGAQHGAGRDDSKGFGAYRPARPGVLGLRGLLAAAGLAGAVALLLATFTTVVQVAIGAATKATASDLAASGWDRHGPALLVLAVLALWLLTRALRRSRVAMAGLAATGLAVLVIAMVSDRPHVHDTGAIADLYAEATANPGAGYYLETLGGALLLVSGGSLLVLGTMPSPTPTAAPRGRPS